MDKVKLYLEIARKHHFWILTVLSAVVAVVAWYLASGKLAAQFQQDSNQINGVFTGLKGISADQPHDDWSEGIKKETAVVAQDVKDAWTKLYQEQKDKVFVWPDQLSVDFRQAAAQLDDPNATLSRNLREYYQRMVRQQVSRLAEIVDAAPLDQLPNQNNGFGPGAAAAATSEYPVDWSTSSQQDILASFDWTERPSTLLVKYAQEELWVYRALCNVIKAVNEGANGKTDPHIQEIDALEIAYNAVEDTPGGTGQNRVEPLGNSAASGPPVTPPMSTADLVKTRPDPKNRGKGQSSGRIGFGSAGGDATVNPDDLLKNYRYVKVDGTPQLKDDVDADTNEYRLMPFRLLLKMDSRYVDHLLVAFRNSVLPMEVQQVRINPEHTSSSGVSSHIYHGGAGPGLPSGPGFGPGGGERAIMGAQQQQQQQQQQDRNVTVEVRGVVYLIKPPDPQKLPVVATTDNAASGAPVSAPDATAGPATPAPAATAPPATPPATTEPTTPPAQPTTPPAQTTTPPAGTEPAAPPAGNPTPPNP